MIAVYPPTGMGDGAFTQRMSLRQIIENPLLSSVVVFSIYRPTYQRWHQVRIFDPWADQTRPGR